VVDARADTKGNITQVRLSGAERFIPVEQAIGVADREGLANAHAVHPNFADRHDPRHGPIINEGPALKTNANQSYATNSESAAVFRLAAERAEVPLQAFVARADMGCGSTIGPLAATRLGVRTVDVGVPTFAMHSIRELAGTADAFALYRALKAFYTLPRVVVD